MNIMADERYTLNINAEEREMLSSLLSQKMVSLLRKDRYSDDGLTDLEEKDLGICIHLYNKMNDSFMEHLKKQFPFIFDENELCDENKN